MSADSKTAPFALRVSPPPLTRRLVGVGAISGIVALWWLATLGPGAEERLISPVILPSPAEVIGSFPSLVRDRALVASIAATLQRVLEGFGLAVLVGVPLGIAAWRWPRSEAALLGAVAVLQTVPSLALLAFLIALVGAIGVVPAVIALFLYALLPIVRNTHAGLRAVSGGMAQAALSLGMTARQALVHVQLPLAAPTLLALSLIHI